MSRLSFEHDSQLLHPYLQPVEGLSDYDALIEMAGAAQFVLIGEASHGTEEFYATRAELTKRLIQEKGFQAVVCEADWPDSFRVHRYVAGRGDDASADEALSDFRRFPAWMWRNRVVVDFVEWLRDWNRQQGKLHAPVGFYGMDLYSLHSSIEAVLKYLDKVDPNEAKRARHRYSCFEHFSHEPQQYALATTFRGHEPCDDEVIDQLVELQRRQSELMQRDGRVAEEEFFSAEQNARLVMNAERYYRSMYHGRDESWNLRDSHMFETLCELVSHLDDGKAKAVVWAHNSHLGDARATEMSERGEHNVGQLVRERFGKDAVLIGFSTYSGTVTAASDWGEPAERKRVRPGMRGSYEALFHETGIPSFWVNLRNQERLPSVLSEPRLQRAIGVIYRPETERWSHYFQAHLAKQFDAMIHIDQTHALHPLERTSTWDEGEFPETYPSSL